MFYLASAWNICETDQRPKFLHPADLLYIVRPVLKNFATYLLLWLISDPQNVRKSRPLLFLPTFLHPQFFSLLLYRPTLFFLLANIKKKNRTFFRARWLFILLLIISPLCTLIVTAIYYISEPHHDSWAAATLLTTNPKQRRPACTKILSLFPPSIAKRTM